jgi:hypothetical protein
MVSKKSYKINANMKKYLIFYLTIYLKITSEFHTSSDWG